ncbi:MAG: hypothetical protein BWY76_02606 [bacterium ADurb.Bin429]|nr:MAG: hypothetical protein BWY76_02606 [bacterium ADurb.Bin429]
MGDGDNRARVLLQVPLQPRHRLGVQMIRRLVEQEDVRLGEEQPAERHAAPLAAGEDVYRRVARRAAQRVHRDFQPLIQVPRIEFINLFLQLALLLDERVNIRVVIAEGRADGVVARHHVHNRLHRLLHHLLHRLLGIQSRLLLQQPHRVTLGEIHLAGVVLVHPRHDAQQRGFPRAVQPEHADLRPVVKAEGDIAQHLPIRRKHPPHPHHRVNHLLGISHETILSRMNAGI